MSVRKTMSHEQAVELLPWLVNGSMDADERARVREHARACVVCRRELEELELISNFIADAAKSEPVPTPDMRPINARIDHYIERRGRMRERLARILGGSGNPWRRAFLVQSAVVVALAVALWWPRSEAPGFITLTQPAVLAEGPHIRAVFRSDLTVSELAALLDERNLTVAAGPSAQGVYTLSLPAVMPPESRDALLAGLQQHPDVRFAQWAVHR